MRTDCLLTKGLLMLCVSGVLAAPAAAETVGWRGDGTGRFDESQPPTVWSEDSANVKWKVKIGRGYSSPVLCQGKLLFTAEPSDVVCLDAASGRELWRRSAGYESVLGADEAERIAAKQAEFDQQRQALNEERKALENSDPDSQLQKLKEARQAVDQRRRDFEREFPPEKRGGAGNAAATPICDGSRCFAVFGTGIVAAFDLNGERLWVRRLEAPQQGFGHSASPLLAGGRLIVHIERLHGLDPATGKTVWQTELPAKYGSPVVATIGGADVVVTPAGSFVLAADGKVLAEKQFSLSNNSPLIADDLLFAHESGTIRAFRLPPSVDSPFELELRWETKSTRDQRMASAVLHNNLLYAAGRRGIMDVTDAKTGESVYRRRLDIGELFASPSAAGDYIFYPGRDGSTLVLRPGREYQTVAVNPSDRLSATPVFDRGHLYLRGHGWLYCIEGERR